MYISIVMICPLYNKFPPLNKWLTCSLYLRNGLLSVMMQQSCNSALPSLGEELAHMKYNLCAKFYRCSLCNKTTILLSVQYFLLANMYHRVTTRIDLMPYNNIFHIQSILCFITTGRASRFTKLGTYFFVNQIVCLRTRIGHLTFRALQIVVCARVYANVCLAMLLLNILG